MDDWTLERIKLGIAAPGEAVGVYTLVADYNSLDRYRRLAAALGKRGWSQTRLEKLLGGKTPDVGPLAGFVPRGRNAMLTGSVDRATGVPFLLAVTGSSRYSVDRTLNVTVTGCALPTWCVLRLQTCAAQGRLPPIG